MNNCAMRCCLLKSGKTEKSKGSWLAFIPETSISELRMSSSISMFSMSPEFDPEDELALCPESSCTPPS